MHKLLLLTFSIGSSLALTACGARASNVQEEMSSSAMTQNAAIETHSSSSYSPEDDYTVSNLGAAASASASTIELPIPSDQ